MINISEVFSIVIKKMLVLIFSIRYSTKSIDIPSTTVRTSCFRTFTKMNHSTLSLYIQYTSNNLVTIWLQVASFKGRAEFGLMQNQILDTERLALAQPTISADKISYISRHNLQSSITLFQ